MVQYLHCRVLKFPLTGLNGHWRENHRSKWPHVPLRLRPPEAFHGISQCGRICFIDFLFSISGELPQLDTENQWDNPKLLDAPQVFVQHLGHKRWQMDSSSGVKEWRNNFVLKNPIWDATHGVSTCFYYSYSCFSMLHEIAGHFEWHCI